MFRKFSLLVIVLVFLAGCQYIQAPERRTYETFSLNSSDGVSIAVNYYPSDADKGLILLHSLSKSKDSYKPYAKELQQYYKVIVPDLRGHGDSDMELIELAESDFKGMRNDVEAAALYLQQEGVAQDAISVVGASIGANLALLYASEHPVNKLVLISPGSNYRGLDLSRISYAKPLFIQVGYYDAYAAISVSNLELLLSSARVMTYDTSAHGTDLLQYDLSAKEDFFFYLT